MGKWSERKAWKYLAKRWGKAKGVKGTYVDFKVVYYAKILGQKSHCLCFCLNDLYENEKLSMNTQISMLGRIEKLPTFEDTRLCWKPNKKGSKKRAAFCRKMARKLK